MFVISGLPENNEKALFLLYNQVRQLPHTEGATLITLAQQLESEKERRVQSVAEEDQAQE
jgi:heterogeneous nuclear rnp K-like protein